MSSMAERRRRKRLDDRLSMLRSIVPKNSKPERSSVLGDTVDYMKELLERIRRLQEELGKEQPALVSPNELPLAPKLEVERRQDVGDTRVEICCAKAKPGLLLSTASTLDALGLDVQHCAVSCFEGFAMHASCSESTRREMLSADDIKRQLLKNAGYGEGADEEAPPPQQKQ